MRVALMPDVGAGGVKARRAIAGAAPAAPTVRRASGTPGSEIKAEPKTGDFRGGEYPVACAHTLTNNAPNITTPNTGKPQTHAR